MNTLDLKKQYSLLNNEIFDNQLPENLPVKWNHSKTSMGKTRIRFSQHGKHDISMTISKFFICSEKEYTETLIHEMIHVLMVTKGEFRKDNRVHGPLFRKYMNQINEQFPHYKISIREERQLPVDQKRIKTRAGYFLIIDKKHYFNLYYEGIDEKMKKKIIRSLKRGFQIRNGRIYFFTGKYEELATAPVRRTIRTLTGKLQFLRDKAGMESLFEKIQKDFPHFECIN